MIFTLSLSIICKLRNAGCKNLTLHNTAMEICVSILKASWQRKHMFVNNIHSRSSVDQIWQPLASAVIKAYMSPAVGDSSTETILN